MSDTFDDLFDDEQELAAAVEASVSAPADAAAEAPVSAPAAADEPAEGDGGQAPSRLERAEHPDASEAPRVAEAKEGTQPARGAATAGSERKAPPFWMVLAIAAISLVLGVVIGYLIGTSTTIAELEQTAGQRTQQEGTAQDGSVSMPEGHPQVEVDEEGNATVSEDGTGTTSDPLTLANNFFDMGMSAMASADDEESQAQARDLFTQAIAHYDTYLAEHASASAEVDRAICRFYSGDHEGAIADLEAFTKRDATFAPAWANLGMFYESHGDTSKAIDAYEQAIAAAEQDDTYGVKDYAQQHLDALKN